MTSLCEHGKPVADTRDLEAYASRPECWASGGHCDCWECSRVCWDTGCMAPLLWKDDDPEPWDAA